MIPMWLECELNVTWMWFETAECLLNITWMCPECDLNVTWICPECDLNVNVPRMWQKLYSRKIIIDTQLLLLLNYIITNGCDLTLKLREHSNIT